jgi:hypothetical protein
MAHSFRRGSCLPENSFGIRQKIKEKNLDCYIEESPLEGFPHNIIFVLIKAPETEAENRFYWNAVRELMPDMAKALEDGGLKISGCSCGYAQQYHGFFVSAGFSDNLGKANRIHASFKGRSLWT